MAWYIAYIIEEILVGAELDAVCINATLIEANSDENAYEKAIQLGQESDITYLNTYGEEVRCKFRGLEDLIKIGNTLQHGSELYYTELDVISEEDLQQLAKPKQELQIFRQTGLVS